KLGEVEPLIARPSLWNHHVPLPVTPIMAIPWRAPSSTSVTRLPRISATNCGGFDVGLLGMGRSLGCPCGSNTGASFTGVTVMRAVSLAMLNELALPLSLKLVLEPASPNIWSQAR